MKISGEYHFDAPRALVWEALLDPTVLAQVLPGCDELRLVGDREYEGALNIKVGPVQGKFSGIVKLEDVEELAAYTMKVDGRGAPGFVKAAARVGVADAAGGGTDMTYDSDAQVGGRIASVGQRLVEASGKAIVKQSLDGLREVVEARARTASGGGEGTEGPAGGGSAAGGGAATAAGGSGPEEPPRPARASQAHFAAGVAREVARELVPRPARIVLAVALGGAAVLVIYLLVR